MNLETVGLRENAHTLQVIESSHYKVTLYVFHDKLSVNLEDTSNHKMLPCRIKYGTTENLPSNILEVVSSLGKEKILFLPHNNHSSEIWLLLNDKHDAVFINAAHKQAQKAKDLPPEASILCYQKSLSYLKTALRIQEKQRQDTTELKATIRNHTQELLGKLLLDTMDLKDLDRIIAEAIETELSRGGNFLHFTIWSGHYQLLTDLFNLHPSFAASLIEEKDTQGRTPFSLASYLGDEASITFLFEKGANLTTRDYEGNTVLHWCVKGKAAHTLQYLVELGCNLGLYNHYQQNPLALAQSMNEQACVNMIEKLSKGNQFKPKDYFPENLVIQGGGPRGLAYVTALEEMEKVGALQNLKRVGGASSGAITSLLLALGYTSSDIERISNSFDLKKVLDFPENYDYDRIKEIIAQLKNIKERLQNKEYMGLARSYLWGTYNESIESLQFFNTNCGVCEGKFFLDLLEENIEKKAGPLLTFGELGKLVEKDSSFKHLYVVATKISPNQGPVIFSSEDPKCADVIISYAIRASMSIPAVFKPGKIYKKSNGTKNEEPEPEEYVDGGLLCNYPLELFDKKKYKKSMVSEEQGEDPWVNPFTWGLSLYYVEEPPQHEDPSLFSDLKKIVTGIYYDAEMVMRNKPRTAIRSINIDNRGVGLLDFDLPKEKRDELLLSGKISTRAFLGECKLTRIGKSDLNYSSIDLKIKQRDGQINLKVPHPYFITRPSLLSKLENLMPIAKEAQLLLYGIGGTGKSELAIAFAYLHLDDYSFIWCIDAETAETRDHSYRRLAEALGITFPDPNSSFLEVRAQVHKKLTEGKFGKPWLLLFDNLSEKLDEYPCKGGTILITARNNEVIDTFPSMEVTAFSPDEGVEFLERITGQHRSDTLREIAKELEYSPLLLNYASHYLASTSGVTLTHYLEQLKSSGKLDLLTQSDPTERYPKSLISTYSTTFEEIKRKNVLATDWLLACSYLSPDHIPKDLLEEWLKTKGIRLKAERLAMSEAIMKLLKNYALVSEENDERYISLHRLSQKVLSIMDHSSTFQGILITLNNYSPVARYNSTHQETIKPFRDVVPHCLAAHSAEKKLVDDPQNSARLTFTLVRYFLEAEANFLATQNCLKKIEPLMPYLSKPFQGRFYFYEGMIAIKQGNYGKALKAFEQAQKLYEEDSNKDSYEGLEQNGDKCNQNYQIAISRYFQALSLKNLGHLDEADKLYEDIKPMFELQPRHVQFDIPRIMRDQVDIKIKQGNKKEARESLMKVIALQKEIYGHRLFDTQTAVAATYTELGKICRELKDYPAAIEAYENALEINEKVYPIENHRYIIRALENYATILKEAGKLDVARKIEEKISNLNMM